MDHPSTGDVPTVPGPRSGSPGKEVRALPHALYALHTAAALTFSGLALTHTRIHHRNGRPEIEYLVEAATDAELIP